MYFACNILSEKTIVFKLKPVKGDDHTLEHKFSVYKKLNKGVSIPLVHYFGTESGFDIMAIDHLSPSLKDLFVHTNF